MYSWVRLRHIVEWTGGELHSTAKADEIVVKNLATDTRDIKSGEVFVALRGDSFDGHNFIDQAYAKGAIAVLAERSLPCRVPLIVVPDALRAMAEVGKQLRNHFKGTVIAVTGSAGKSSTKEVIATLMGDHTVKSPASFNNLQGVSRTLCLVDDSTKFLVLEMGMNALYEIKELCEYFRPEIGMITNIGDAHIGKLGGQEGIFRAKKEMFDFLASAKGTRGIALNVDDRWVTRAYRDAFATPAKIVSYSADPANASEADVAVLGKSISPENGELSLKMKVQGSEFALKLPLFGLHHAQNIAAGIAASLLAGKTISEMKPRFSAIRPAYHRGEMFPLSGGRTLIDESYNSNPTALISSLQSLSQIDPRKRRLLVLGEMRELGEFSESLHRKAGENLGQFFKQSGGPFSVLAVGEHVSELIQGVKSVIPDAECLKVANVDEAIRTVETLSYDIIFVKGSRGIALDRLVVNLQKA